MCLVKPLQTTPSGPQWASWAFKDWWRFPKLIRNVRLLDNRIGKGNGYIQHAPADFVQQSPGMQMFLKGIRTSIAPTAPPPRAAGFHHLPIPCGRSPPVKHTSNNPQEVKQMWMEVQHSARFSIHLFPKRYCIYNTKVCWKCSRW